MKSLEEIHKCNKNACKKAKAQKRNPELDAYLREKIRLFGGSLADAKGGAFAVDRSKAVDASHAIELGILSVLYEVYRIERGK